MNSPETHLPRAEAPLQVCDTCTTAFTPKRSWSRFCSTRCRNAFHGAEARKEAIRARALPMYEALVKIASFGEGTVVTGCFDEPAAAAVAREALKDLKPPVQPQDLLKPKAEVAPT